MRRVLAALFLLLAFLLSFAGTAWARAVLPPETRVGVSGPYTNTSTYEIDPLSLQMQWEDTTWSYDFAPDVLVYVNQNPWSAFDAEGLWKRVLGKGLAGNAYRQLGKRLTKRGIRDLVQIQHLIPQAAFKNKKLGKAMAELGFGRNQLSNVMAMPKSKAAAAKLGTKRGTHDGWTKSHSKYNEEIRGKIQDVVSRWKGGGIGKEAAQKQIRAIQTKTRQAIRSGQISLADGAVKAGKGMAFVGGIPVVAAGGAMHNYINAVQNYEREMEAWQSSARKAMNDVSYATAEKYLGGFGAVLDWANPLGLIEVGAAVELELKMPKKPNPRRYGLPPKKRPIIWGPTGCFIAGTLVSVSEGAVPIDELKIGDEVYSYSHDEQTPKVSKVSETHVHVVGKVFEILLSSGIEIVTTAEHPFFEYDSRNYLRADQLTVGMKLMSRSGDLIEIEGVEVVERKVEVFNITVSGNHNYFVSEAEVLVHNKPLP